MSMSPKFGGALDCTRRCKVDDKRCNEYDKVRNQQLKSQSKQNTRMTEIHEHLTNSIEAYRCPGALGAL
jgi:hypothetical protein